MKICILIISLFHLTTFVGFAQPFTTTWETTVSNESITIPTSGNGYFYQVDWGDGTISTNVTGDAIHSFTSPGTHTISITGQFPRIYFNDTGDKDKIISIDQWGSINWSSMLSAFSGASNLTYNATDSPNLTNVTDMSLMFHRASSFNGDLSNWDVSNVTEMFGMFHVASSFNGDLTTWDVSNVQNMILMFGQAGSFNQDISGWDISSVTDIYNMFDVASSFNQNLGGWDISSVNNLTSFLDYSGLSVTNYDNTLIGWESQMVYNLNFGATSLAYCNSETERTSLINTYGWNIYGDIFDCAPLPVEFTAFNATLTENNKVKLSWRTVSEINNSGFEIEHSTNGLEWENLGFLKGGGTSLVDSEYEFIHYYPSLGINYYRLKQIDFDGEFEYTKIISILIKTEFEIEIYPNPSEGKIKIIGTNISKFKILDNVGRVLKKEPISNQVIDISHLASGVYIIQIKTRNQWVSKKLVKF